jgi:hypothetical protein
LNGLQLASACKILYLKGLRAKYSIQMGYEIFSAQTVKEKPLLISGAFLVLLPLYLSGPNSYATLLCWIGAGFGGFGD